MLTVENLTKAVLQDFLVWAWRMTGQLSLGVKKERHLGKLSSCHKAVPERNPEQLGQLLSHVCALDQVLGS